MKPSNFYQERVTFLMLCNVGFDWTSRPYLRLLKKALFTVVNLIKSMKEKFVSYFFSFLIKIRCRKGTLITEAFMDGSS